MLAGKALPVWCVKWVHFRAMGKRRFLYSPGMKTGAKERGGRAMNREMLQKLFSEDKEVFQGGMLFPAWICKGKKEIENILASLGLDIPVEIDKSKLYY